LLLLLMLLLLFCWFLQGLAHYIDWSRTGLAGTHPKTFKPGDISPALVHMMRTGRQENGELLPATRAARVSKTAAALATEAACDAAAAIQSAARLFTSLKDGPGFTVARDRPITDAASNSQTLDKSNWLSAAGFAPLGSHCPLFARKFPNSSINRTLAMALSCSGLGLASWC
jgi:hypothetical protein